MKLIWIRMIEKSILKKKIIWFLLLLLPVLAFSLKLVSEQRSGIQRILLVAEDSDDELSNQVMTQLLSQDSVLLFERWDDGEAAILEVEEERADAVWVFASDFSETMKQYCRNKKLDASPIRIIERKDSPVLQMTREKLYGQLFRYLSKEMFLLFVEENSAPEDVPSKLAFAEDVYERMRLSEGIFQFVYPEGVDGTEQVQEEITTGYLIAPLRGLLVMVIQLCSLAAACFYMQDEKKQVFSGVSGLPGILLPYYYQFAGMFPISIVVLVSFYLAGIANGLAWEGLLLLCYLVAQALATELLRKLLHNEKAFAVSIPFVSIATTILGQIFLALHSVKWLCAMVPLYYYLNGVYNSSFVLKFFLYILMMLGIQILSDFLIFQKKSAFFLHK